MFDTNNLGNEPLTANSRKRLFGKWPMMDERISYTVMSPSKGAIYIMCGAQKIYKVYPRLTEAPHTVFTHSIVGVKGSEHLESSDVRAMDVIEHVCELRGEKKFFYSRLVIHTKKGQCFILCEDPPHLKSGHAKLQIEETDKYPPNDAVPLEDFALPLPAQRSANAR